MLVVARITGSIHGAVRLSLPSQLNELVFVRLPTLEEPFIISHHLGFTSPSCHSQLGFPLRSASATPPLPLPLACAARCKATDSLRNITTSTETTSINRIVPTPCLLNGYKSSLRPGCIPEARSQCRSPSQSWTPRCGHSTRDKAML